MSKSFSPNPEEKAHASSSPPTRDRSSSSRQGGQDDGRLWQRLAFGAHDEAEHAGGEKAQAVREQMGEGRLLEAGVRGQMEHGFGSALRHVRVHTDGEAGSLAGREQARAVTVGSDIAFGAGEYKPGSLSGDLLIAHELAHVLQQESGGASLP